MRTVKNAELSDINQSASEVPAISIKSKGKQQDKIKYDITISNNEYNVLDDLDLEVETDSKKKTDKKDKTDTKKKD